MSKRIIKLSVISLMCSVALPVFAAKSVDLRHQNIQYLKSLTVSKTLAATGVSIKETNQSTDFNQTLHTRIQQNYAGYPVWGADAVVHTPQAKNKNFHALMASAETASTMNGTVYEGLQKDLQATPAHVFTDAQADKALAQAVANIKDKMGMKIEVTDQQKQLMVYVDKQGKAHWAFYVKSRVQSDKGLAMPTYIMDANDFHVYQEWNDLKTHDREPVQSGGFGGNKKNKVVYDGLAGHLPKLDIERDAATKTCSLKNPLAKVLEYKGTRRGTEIKELVKFPCEKPDSQHNNIYWYEGKMVNGGYSPNNDALFAAKVINDMYQGWYKVPVLVKNGKPMVLTMVTHMIFDEGTVYMTKENAAWDDVSESMYFGDGESMFYPLTSLGIAAHEISHGFTSQHSNLVYKDESGAMNESFSDMADQAANYFATGKNNFKVGAEITKLAYMEALRYMETPSKDGESADSYDDYLAYQADHGASMEVHSSSGIYNRAFYLLATSKDWNTKMAFDVMVKANSDYWTSNTTFKEGACGVIKATADYKKAVGDKYDTAAVREAFKAVKVDTSGC